MYICHPQKTTCRVRSLQTKWDVGIKLRLLGLGPTAFTQQALLIVLDRFIKCIVLKICY